MCVISPLSVSKGPPSTLWLAEEGKPWHHRNVTEFQKFSTSTVYMKQKLLQCLKAFKDILVRNAKILFGWITAKK